MTSLVDRAMTSKVKATLAFIKSTIAPELYHVPPPTIEPRGQIVKDVTINGQFQMPSGALINEQVPNNSGIVLWLCNRGITSIYRMNIVPVGTTAGPLLPTPPGGTSYISRGLNGFPLDFTANQSPSTAVQSAFGSITFVQQLALPVYNNGTDTIQIKPDIPTEVAFTRLFAGFVSCISGTTSIGNFALTGNLSVASIEDTRDIAQTSTAGAFAVTTIMQSAETNKEGVFQVSVDSGVLALLANDIPYDFTTQMRTTCSLSMATTACFAQRSMPMVHCRRRQSTRLPTSRHLRRRQTRLGQRRVSPYLLVWQFQTPATHS